MKMWKRYDGLSDAEARALLQPDGYARGHGWFGWGKGSLPLGYAQVVSIYRISPLAWMVDFVRSSEDLDPRSAKDDFRAMFSGLNSATTPPPGEGWELGYDDMMGMAWERMTRDGQWANYYEKRPMDFENSNLRAFTHHKNENSRAPESYKQQYGISGLGAAGDVAERSEARIRAAVEAQKRALEARDCKALFENLRHFDTAWSAGRTNTGKLSRDEQRAYQQRVDFLDEENVVHKGIFKSKCLRSAAEVEKNDRAFNDHGKPWYKRVFKRRG